MPDNELVFADRLGALRAAYGAALPGRLEFLRGAVHALMPDTAWDDIAPTLEAIRAAAHMFTGSAPTFGFTAVGEGARALERRAKAQLLAREPLSRAAVAEMQASVERLLVSAHRPDMPALDMPALDMPVLDMPVLDMPVLDMPDATGPIALIATADPVRRELTQRLEDAGFPVAAIGAVEDVGVAVAGGAPHAILVQGDGALDASMALLGHVRRQCASPRPVVFFSAAGDFAARYAASQAGAVGFLRDPVRLLDLPARLDGLIAAAPVPPYRVLYVGAAAPVWDADGFLLSVVADPALLLARLRDFQPELLLLGTDLPGYDAIDLARMVWQDAAYQDVGIFFACHDPAVRHAMLARGVTDAYCVPRLGDDGGLAAPIMRYLHARRARQRAPNREDLGPCLARLGGGFLANMGAVRSPPVVPASVGPGPGGMEKKRRKILIVDDDQYLVAMLAHALSERGADVLRAYSGEQGYVTAWQELPSVIVSDVEMPHGNGDRMMLQLRSNLRTRDIPVIVITNRRWEDGRDYALEREMRGRLGAAAYLQKPVQIDLLVRELARL